VLALKRSRQVATSKAVTSHRTSKVDAERVNTPVRIEAARSKIADLLTMHAEWFCTLNSGDSQALSRSELDIAVAYGRLILTTWTERESRAWKIFDWELTGDKLTLRASRRMGLSGR